MNNERAAVDQVRAETQNLYKQIRENTSENHAALRADLQNAGTQAQHLAASLRTLAGDRRNDEQHHLEHAAVLLEAASAGVETIANASTADLRSSKAAMLERTRDALQNISRTIAERRAAAPKQHA